MKPFPDPIDHVLLRFELIEALATLLTRSGYEFVSVEGRDPVVIVAALRDGCSPRTLGIVLGFLNRLSAKTVSVCFEKAGCDAALVVCGDSWLAGGFRDREWQRIAAKFSGRLDFVSLSAFCWLLGVGSFGLPAGEALKELKACVR